MKIFDEQKRMVIQGDVCFTRVFAIPDNKLTTVQPEGGQIVVTHSETGHHHSFDEYDDVAVLDDPNNSLVSWLEVFTPSNLTHHRPFNQHETIQFTPGVYRINRQREHFMEGFRQVQD